MGASKNKWVLPLGAAALGIGAMYALPALFSGAGAAAGASAGAAGTAAGTGAAASGAGATAVGAGLSAGTKGLIAASLAGVGASTSAQMYSNYKQNELTKDANKQSESLLKGRTPEYTGPSNSNILDKIRYRSGVKKALLTRNQKLGD